MSVDRRRKRLRGGYKQEYSEHLSRVLANSGLDITKNFIIVGEDRPNLYPTPDSIVALTSSENYLSKKDSDNPYLEEDEEDETRTFDNCLATKADGLEETRYYGVVDQITSDGEVVVFDDLGGCHKFKDSEVMVVELYFYSASAYLSTFEKDFDYANQLLAVKLTEVYTKNEICNIINDNNTMMYERVLMSLPMDVRHDISTIYVSRGLAFANKQRKIIRMVLERTMLLGDTFEEGLTPYLAEFVSAIRTKGYHLDVVTNTYYKNRDKSNDIIEKLKNVGVISDSWNGSYKYDFIVDGRSAMSLGKIDWTLVYKTITGEDLVTEQPSVDFEPMGIDAHKMLMDGLDSEIKTASDKINQEISNELVSKLDEATDKVLETQYNFDGSNTDLLYISKSTYKELSDTGNLFMLYPLSPVEWDYIDELQKCFRTATTFDDLHIRIKEMVEVLKLEKHF